MHQAGYVYAEDMNQYCTVNQRSRDKNERNGTLRYTIKHQVKDEDKEITDREHFKLAEECT